MRAISNNYHVSISSFPEEILTKYFFISIARTLKCSAITTGLGVPSSFLTSTVITVTHLGACAEGSSILISSNSESVSLSCSTDSCKQGQNFPVSDLSGVMI